MRGKNREVLKKVKRKTRDIFMPASKYQSGLLQNYGHTQDYASLQLVYTRLYNKWYTGNEIT